MPALTVGNNIVPVGEVRANSDGWLQPIFINIPLSIVDQTLCILNAVRHINANLTTQDIAQVELLLDIIPRQVPAPPEFIYFQDY